jgi:hypothetical protein
MEKQDSKVFSLIKPKTQNLIYWDAWPDISSLKSEDDVVES